jgi:hypothetical protein
MKTKPKTLQELFSKRGSWCKKNLAKDSDNSTVSVNSPFACKFCLYGGILYVYGGSPTRVSSIYNKLESIIGDDLTDYNDKSSRTIKDIRELVKKAGV